MVLSNNPLLDHKIQDGGDPPTWKSSNRRISTKNHPISMKFGTQQQIWNSIKSHEQI